MRSAPTGRSSGAGACRGRPARDAPGSGHAPARGWAARSSTDAVTGALVVVPEVNTRNPTPPGDWSDAVVYYVWYSTTTAFIAVMTAVSYYYLRADKERIAIDDIAAVFD